MAGPSLSPLLALLLIWTATTGGQATDGSSSTTLTYTTFPLETTLSSSTTPPYTNFLTPGTTPSSSTTPPTTSSAATTAGTTPSSTQLVTTENSSTNPPLVSFAFSTDGTTPSSPAMKTEIRPTDPPLVSFAFSTDGTTSSSPALTTGVLQCDPACADNELCTNSAGYAECKCQRGKYLNASRSDIVPTVQCEGSAMTVSLNKCLLERFNYSFTQMRFVDMNCTVTTSLQLEGNERVVQIKAIPRAGWCGNEMVIYDKTVTYSNVLYIPPDDASRIIISSNLRFNFSCTYNMTMQTSLLTALHPIIDTIPLPSEGGPGSITATMAAFKSNSFTDPVSEYDTLAVGTPVYIGISTTFPDEDTFTLRAERCVASPSINLADPSVELISGGCAMTQDLNVQVVENGQSLQVMFEIETFIFNGQPDVYMWCNVSLCLKDPSNTCQCSSSTGSANWGPFG